MGRPLRPTDQNRRSSTIHYQTFPTPPPRSKGAPPSVSPPSSSGRSQHARSNSNSSKRLQTPLPTRQLLMLAVIALSEQTSLNSISPYLPQMASTFPEVEVGEVGLYVGTIASAFALAQFTTNFFWGWLSDRIGRKPVVLIGTLLTAVGFLLFGFCRTLWQAVLVQVFIGLSNGNQAIISTCLGEITDRSNQSRAFVYLPVIYGLGGITGPVLGGLMVAKGAVPTKSKPYPFLPPNLLSAGILFVDLILIMIFLEESLEEAKNLPPLGQRIKNLFSRGWHSMRSSKPTYFKSKDEPPLLQSDGSANDYPEDDDHSVRSYVQGALPRLLPRNTSNLSGEAVFKRDTICILITFMIFQISNISYNSLYPIFGAAQPPIGRNLSPREIGITLGFAGAVTILFQIGIFGRLREKMGNRVTYRAGMGAMVVAYLLTPWVGYKKGDNGDGGIGSGEVWLWIELGIVLFIRAAAAVACLTSALLLITNSAPNHSVLGTLNGLAQTLSAAGRAAGPFLAGGLFSLSTHVHPKGEALAFGVFGAVTFIGFLTSFGIRDPGLEAEDWDEEDSEEDEDNEENEDNDTVVGR